MTGENTQLTLEEMKSMSPREVRDAMKAGRLRDVMRNGDPSRQGGFAQHSRQGGAVQGRDIIPGGSK